MDSIIKSIYEGKTLTEGEGRTLFEAIFEGKVAPVALAGILTALKMRGEKPEEIAGAAAAMRGAALPVPRPEGLTIGEIVGTGNQNLAFRAQTPQSGRMNQSRAIAFESRARLGFGRLGCPSLLVEGAVALIAQHLFPIQSRFHIPSIGTHIGRSNPDFPNMCH